jgi:hypothetical protein
MSRVSISLLSFGAVLVAVGGLQPQPARAQFGIPGIPNLHFQIRPGGNVQIGPGGNGGCGRHCGGGGRHRGGGESDQNATSDDDNSRNKKREDQVLLEIAPPPSSVQTAVLSKMVISTTLNGVGSVKDVVDIGKTLTNKDAERDWLVKVKNIIKKITEKQDKAANSAKYVATAGDVTEHAIEQALVEAFKNAKLDTFERFASENWTTERLRVKVLDIVDAELDHLLNGTNRGNVPMQQLNELIQRAAEKTYARIFELSELLAANRESAQFVQRLYQTHGSLVDNQLREGAEPMIFKAANAAIGPLEVAMRQDSNSYALHYRAERIVYDCLSENIESITSSENGIAAAGEIEHKISDTVANECVAWLGRQFGTQSGAILPQKPVPARVIWSATGPKDDPSMYTRSSGTF